MKKFTFLFSVLVIASLALTACGGKNETPADLLAAIKSRGYILVSTDPNYEPQSVLNTEGSRPTDSKCPSDALTTAEMQGFDVDVAIAIGDALGVETCFATPSWDTITAGSWADKWDVSVGSMTVTPDRQQILDFSVPYYYTPAVIAVAKDSGITSVEDLNGKNLCAGVSTTYETWLNGGELGPEIPIAYAAPTVTIVPLSTDQECAQAIEVGRTDFVGYVTAITVVYSNIADGLPVMLVGEPAFFEPLAAAFDKSSTLPSASLLAMVNELFTKMHSDGTFVELSKKWFKDAEGNGVDYTTAVSN